MDEPILNTGNTKPFKTYDELIQILIDRGLIINDRDYAKSILLNTNYYRLSGYSLTLRKDDHFYPDVTFENIVELYNFDSEFRSLILKYSMIIEVAFRSWISHHHAEKYGPLGYMNSMYFEDSQRYTAFISDLKNGIQDSTDSFIEHHRKDLNGVYPFWCAIEVITFGTLSKLYKNLLLEDRVQIAKKHLYYGREYVENWLQVCSFIRNVSAHGGRLYNRQLRAVPVRIQRSVFKDVDAYSPYASIIAVYNILPSAEYKASLLKDLRGLFNNHPFVMTEHLGFPPNWEELLKGQKH